MILYILRADVLTWSCFCVGCVCGWERGVERGEGGGGGLEGVSQIFSFVCLGAICVQDRKGKM